MFLNVLYCFDFLVINLTLSDENAIVENRFRLQIILYLTKSITKKIPREINMKIRYCSHCESHSFCFCFALNSRREMTKLPLRKRTFLIFNESVVDRGKTAPTKERACRECGNLGGH